MPESNGSCIVVSTKLSLSVIITLIAQILFVAFLVGSQYQKMGKLEEDVARNSDMQERVTRLEEQMLNNNCLLKQFREDFRDFVSRFYSYGPTIDESEFMFTTNTSRSLVGAGEGN